MNLARFVAPFLLVVVLAGCASDPAPAATTTPVAISDADYLALVRAQGWVTPNMADANLLKLGSSACAVITEQPADAALTGWKRAVDAATANGIMSQRDAGGFLVYASARFCPDAREKYFPKV